MRNKIKKAYCVVSVLLLVLTTIHSRTFASESVKTTRLSTGIVFQRLFIDSKGQFAGIFGQPLRSKRRTSSSFSGPPKQLMVIDLKKSKVVAECPTVGHIRSALVDDKQILWVPSNVNLLHRLRFEGAGGPEEIVLDASVEKLFELGPNKFGIVHRSDRNTGFVSIYDRKSLKKIETHPLSEMPLRLVSGGDPIAQLGDSMLYLNERVVDLPEGTNRCFTVAGRQLPQIGGAKKSLYFPSHNSLGNAYWRRTSKKSSSEQFAGTGRVHIHASWSWVSLTHPILATLSVSADRRQQTIMLTIELQDLVHGQVLRRIELSEPVKFEGNHRIQQTAIQMGENTILVAFWDEVFIIKLPMQYLEDVDVLDPLRLLYPTVPIVDIPKSLDFQLAAKGGKKPLRFDLASEVPGVTINSTTGKVTVDYSGIWQAFCEKISISTHYNTGPRSPYINGMLSFDFFGTKAIKGKMLVSLPVEFTVSDQSGQKDRIFVSLIAQAPTEQYKKAKQSAINAQNPRPSKKAKQTDRGSPSPSFWEQLFK